MHLKKIHVAGFKSFVDPTSIRVSANVVGIVGPNGCGKSNVIDAIRWVMGESSARNLRGDSMSDVIFNGSIERKPVGKASVELVFDNSEGKAPDNYASFAEISVKRALSRDGISDYLINNVRCRRRDITDMFRGTGLGHRSYSIIEQGMVGRIIEARPEDLRAFVEEAAGISKYKDRRRETETRIRHTRENMGRVEDIRNELAAQLRKLKRQSQAARRYQKLKDEEHAISGELLALRFRTQSALIDRQSRDTAKAETQVEARITEHRAIEGVMESTRASQAKSQEEMSVIQGELYALGADIAAVEQNIEHARETEHQQRGELDRLRDSLMELQKEKLEDHQRLGESELELDSLRLSRAAQSETLVVLEKVLMECEGNLERWQDDWHEFTEQAAEPARQQEVERSRIEQLDAGDAGLQQRLGRIDEESQVLLEEEESLDLDAVSARVIEGERALRYCSEKQQQVVDDIDRNRKEAEDFREQLDRQRQQLHEMNGRLESLQELQAAALDFDDERYHKWLVERGLGNAPRLAGEVRVDSGWERAADAVLEDRLLGLGVGELETTIRDEDALPGNNLFLMESGSMSNEIVEDDTLLSRLHCRRYDLRPLLTGIYIAESLQEALFRRKSLKRWEFVVTRSGTMVGKNWLRAPRGQGIQVGMLAREEEIHQLVSDLQDVEPLIQKLEQRLEVAQNRSQSAVDEQRELQDQFEVLQAAQSEARGLLAGKEARLVQIKARQDQLEREGDELTAELGAVGDRLAEARRNFALAEDETGSLERTRDALLKRRDQLTEELLNARQTAHECRDDIHKAELGVQKLQVSVDSLRSTIERLIAQYRRIEERQVELEETLGRGDEPERDFKRQLENLLEKRKEVELRLSAAREASTREEEELREQRVRLSEREQDIASARDILEQQRLKARELNVRFEALGEQIKAGSYVIEELLENLSEEASEPDWLTKSDQLAEKIRQIGPVNLVAIEEFDEQSERKDYLDRQYNDLTEALTTLEGVIRKIDRETRERFKTTFEQLNKGFGDFFPQLFGGGSAVLALTEDDLLKAGVTVMARPPGKRNSNIHLLSGGEKALTAVALLFALFRLNPAPFCILDEVDAPLDDANVVRYCATLRSLSERTQLIVITHNKITMESADVLLGVTMGEPGVSAIVSVDIDQAVGFAS